MRRMYKSFYEIKYYNVFMNKFEIEGFDYQQNEYFFRKLWADNSIASFIIAGTKGSKDYPKGLPALCPYAPAMYNIYDYATKCTLVNVRGVKFIPSTLQEIDKDVVIAWSNKAHKSVREILDPLFERIAHIECVIQINLNAHKTPYFIPVAPEDRKKMEELWNLIQDDSEKLFIETENFDKIKILLSGATYIIDKLYALRDQVECEIREILGFSGLPVMEKKEHLISDEVESNDEFVNVSHDSIKDCIQDFVNRFNEVFDYDLKLIDKNEIEQEGKEEEKVIEDEI